MKTALLLTSKNADSLAIAGAARASVSRKLESGEGITNVETKFSFKEKHKEVVMYDEVPKIFAANAAKINVEADGEYQIVKADPVFVFTFKDVEAEKEYKVSYSVVEVMPANVIDVFEKPLLMYDKSEVPIEEEKPAQLSGAAAGDVKAYFKNAVKYWWALAALIIFVVIVWLVVKGRKNKPVEKKV